MIFVVKNSSLVGRDVVFERLITDVSKGVSAITLGLLNSESEDTTFLLAVANQLRNDRRPNQERFFFSHTTVRTVVLPVLGPIKSVLTFFRHFFRVPPRTPCAQVPPLLLT